MTIDDKLPQMQYEVGCSHDTAYVNGVQKFQLYHRINKEFTLYTCLRCHTTFKANENYKPDKDVRIWLRGVNGQFESFGFVRREGGINEKDKE